MSVSFVCFGGQIELSREYTLRVVDSQQLKGSARRPSANSRLGGGYFSPLPKTCQLAAWRWSLLFNSLETCNAKPRCLVLVALTCGRHVAASGHGQPLSCNLPVLLRSAGRLLLRPDPRCTSSTPGCRGRRATTNVAAALCSWTWTKPGAQGGGSWREPRRAFIIRRRRHALGGWRLITSTFVCASCGMAVHGPWCFEIVGLTRSILL